MGLDSQVADIIHDGIGNMLTLTPEETKIAVEVKEIGHVTINESNIVRDKKHKIIKTVHNMAKVFSHTYDKRVILPFSTGDNEIRTVPYGYVA